MRKHNYLSKLVPLDYINSCVSLYLYELIDMPLFLSIEIRKNIR